jgi:hypothetical protein
MDNKQNREFYWEVKDFMTSRNTQNPVSTPTPKSSIADQAKLILEKKQSFPQKPLEINNTIMNAACQVIGTHQKQEAGYNPQSKAFSKNSDVNSFRGINEGFWEDFKRDFSSGLDAIFTNQNTYKPTPTLTSQQASMNAVLNKASSENKLNADQLNLERLTSGKPLTSDDLLKRIALQDIKPGVPLTPEQKRERDLAGELKREEGLEQMAQDDVEAEEVGSTIVRTSDGREYGTKPSSLSTSTSPASSALAKPAVPGVNTEGPPSSLSGSPTSTGTFGMSTPSFGGEVSDKTKGLLASMDAKKANANTSSTTPTATTSDSQKAERKARQEEINKKRKRQELERRLVYRKTLDAETDYSKNKFSGARHKASAAASIKQIEQELEDLG